MRSLSGRWRNVCTPAESLTNRSLSATLFTRSCPALEWMSRRRLKNLQSVLGTILKLAVVLMPASREHRAWDASKRVRFRVSAKRFLFLTFMGQSIRSLLSNWVPLSCSCAPRINTLLLLEKPAENLKKVISRPDIWMGWRPHIWLPWQCDHSTRHRSTRRVRIWTETATVRKRKSALWFEGGGGITEAHLGEAKPSAYHLA